MQRCFISRMHLFFLFVCFFMHLEICLLSLPPLHQKTKVNFSAPLRHQLQQPASAVLQEALWILFSFTNTFEFLTVFFFFFITSCHLLYNSPLPLVGRKPVICAQNLHSRGPLTVNGRWRRRGQESSTADINQRRGSPLCNDHRFVLTAVRC